MTQAVQYLLKAENFICNNKEELVLMDKILTDQIEAQIMQLMADNHSHLLVSLLTMKSLRLVDSRDALES